MHHVFKTQQVSSLPKDTKWILGFYAGLLKVNIPIKDMIVWLNIPRLSISKPFYIFISDQTIYSRPVQVSKVNGKHIIH